MTNDEYRQFNAQVALLCQAIEMLPLDELTEMQNRAAAAASLVDPTLFLQKKDDFEVDRGRTNALRTAQKKLIEVRKTYELRTGAKQL